jgi:replicative DNA helicase
MSSTVQLSQNIQKEVKELPHNAEAEQGLLGAILLNNDIADEVSSIIDSNHFFEEIHKRIYEVINRLIAKGQLATPVTLKSKFETYYSEVKHHLIPKQLPRQRPKRI